MNNTNRNVAEELAQKGIFAILLVITPEGEVVPRPIGNPFGSSIHEAILEMNERYPSSKMKLFEQNYDSWRRYFNGIIDHDQLL